MNPFMTMTDKEFKFWLKAKIAEFIGLILLPDVGKAIDKIVDEASYDFSSLRFLGA